MKAGGGECASDNQELHSWELVLRPSAIYFVHHHLGSAQVGCVCCDANKLENRISGREPSTCGSSLEVSHVDVAGRALQENNGTRAKAAPTMDGLGASCGFPEEPLARTPRLFAGKNVNVLAVVLRRNR